MFNHEEASFQEFCEKNEALRKAGTGAQGYAATMVPVVVSISYINCAIVAVLGGILALQGKADLGSLASYLVFVRQAALPINQFTQQSNFLLAALAGAERVFKVMDLEPEVDEGKVELVQMEVPNKIESGCLDSKYEKKARKKKLEVQFQHGKMVHSGRKKLERMTQKGGKILCEMCQEMPGRGRSQVGSWCLFEGMYGLSMWTSVMMRIG